MGFIMGLLKFAHFLAWPVVALGYPLFASIRAIETGSEYHMKKLLIYWTLVSLLSLFEFTFVKIIEWIPFWSSIKLIAVLWLAMPRFHGACYAYKSYIRPCLVVYLQEVIRRFEEQCSTIGIFLDDVADRYEKENEFGDSEKLIVIESDEKNDASALEQQNEPAAAALELKDNQMLGAIEKKSAGCAAATQTKQVTNGGATNYNPGRLNERLVNIWRLVAADGGGRWRRRTVAADGGGGGGWSADGGLSGGVRALR
ncbi:hypothetical protein OROHE_018994 [Orobanche hederae]